MKAVRQTVLVMELTSTVPGVSFFWVILTLVGALHLYCHRHLFPLSVA